MILGDYNTCSKGMGHNGGGAEEHRIGALHSGQHKGVCTQNPTINTWLQFRKMNTFNENKQIFTEDNNSKGNDNNEVNKSECRGASSHRLKYRQRENKIKRKPFLSTIHVLSLAQSWSFWNLESRPLHQHFSRQSMGGTPHQGSEPSVTASCAPIVLTDSTKSQRPVSCLTTRAKLPQH